MAYYGLGSKESILANLDTALSTVTGIQTVDYERDRYTEARVENYPGIYINDMRNDKTRLLKNLSKNILTVALIGWVWATEGENLATKLNAFVEEVKDKIMTDPYRNSNAYDTQITIEAVDAGSKHPKGQVLLELIIPFYSSE